MIGDLPTLDEFFNEETRLKRDGAFNSDDDSGIHIYISKEKDKWILSEFLDVAVAGIGIHVRLPIFIELNSTEINNVRIKFSKKVEDEEIILKETQVLVRWQEFDEINGNLKLGLHFHGDLKNDVVLIELLKKFKNRK
ncbi:MAG TPA: hypothetical protein PK771_11815 [Spirochaetota bacterium]|nr:hypothetical protein [Spirochaetota bacterium]